MEEIGGNEKIRNIDFEKELQDTDNSKIKQGIIKEKTSTFSPIISLCYKVENLFYSFTFNLLSFTFKNLFVGPADWITQYLLPIFIKTTLSQFQKFNSKIHLSINFIFRLIQVDHSSLKF